MKPIQDILLAVVRHKARRTLRRYASELAHGASHDAEAIQAAIALERWLAESCDACLKAD